MVASRSLVLVGTRSIVIIFLLLIAYVDSIWNG
jgi:hypothetical protein